MTLLKNTIGDTDYRQLKSHPCGVAGWSVGDHKVIHNNTNYQIIK